MKELGDPAHLVWRRSTKCESGLCVEVAVTAQTALVRDGKRPNGPHLSFGPRSWDDFLTAIKAGEYDRH
jgi:hypothetical protein